MIIDNIFIKPTNFSPSKEELANYVAYVKERVPEVDKIEVTLADDDNVDLQWTDHSQKFERIRRITGYLVGTTDRWNDAKQAEESDRVKHSVTL